MGQKMGQKWSKSDISGTFGTTPLFGPGPNNSLGVRGVRVHPPMGTGTPSHGYGYTLSFGSGPKTLKNPILCQNRVKTLKNAILCQNRVKSHKTQSSLVDHLWDPKNPIKPGGPPQGPKKTTVFGQKPLFSAKTHCFRPKPLFF